jgi:TetR/AcrR family transcriptional regulator, transcriptional repressor of bet genes
VPRIVDVDERRSELAAAASRVIARLGIAGASMREVAAEAGWTTGTLVHYFTDKHELLRFTLEESLERRHALGARRESMTPDDALRDRLMAALPTDDDARLHWIVTIAFCAQAAADDDLADVQRRAYREFRSGVAKLVVQSGRAVESQARAEAERLIAVVDGVAMQALFDPASWPPSRQRAVVDGALSPSV